MCAFGKASNNKLTGRAPCAPPRSTRLGGTPHPLTGRPVEPARQRGQGVPHAVATIARDPLSQPVVAEERWLDAGIRLRRGGQGPRSH